MMSRLSRHITYANVAATMAVVLAMSGGAYAVSSRTGAPGAAGGHFSASVAAAKKKKPPVGKPGPRGPRGPAGPAGPAGLQGPVGPVGPVGPKGENGTNGANGAEGHEGKQGEKGVTGTNGTSATTANVAAGQHGCGAGGVEVKSASSPAFVCDGENGQTGFTETLPSGKTEVGTYAAYIPNITDVTTKIPVAISFPIPVEGANTSKAFFLKALETNSECSGKAEEPTAAPGVLCVYESESLRTEFVEHTPEEILSFKGTPYDRAGSRMRFVVEGTAQERAEKPARLVVGGAWAVTAP